MVATWSELLERLRRALTSKLLSFVTGVEVVWMETTATSFLFLLLGHAIIQPTMPKSNSITPISVNLVIKSSLTVTATGDKRHVSFKKSPIEHLLLNSMYTRNASGLSYLPELTPGPRLSFARW
jgi:hypothetical protein